MNRTLSGFRTVRNENHFFVGMTGIAPAASCSPNTRSSPELHPDVVSLSSSRSIRGRRGIRTLTLAGPHLYSKQGRQPVSLRLPNTIAELAAITIAEGVGLEPDPSSRDLSCVQNRRGTSPRHLPCRAEPLASRVLRSRFADGVGIEPGPRGLSCPPDRCGSSPPHHPTHVSSTRSNQRACHRHAPEFCGRSRNRTRPSRAVRTSRPAWRHCQLSVQELSRLLSPQWRESNPTFVRAYERIESRLRARDRRFTGSTAKSRASTSPRTRISPLRPMLARSRERISSRCGPHQRGASW